MGARDTGKGGESIFAMFGMYACFPLSVHSWVDI